MSAYKAHIIINPVSAGGKTWRRRKAIFSEIKKCWDDFIVEYTEKPGDAVIKTRQAIMSGRNLIVAVGGDGTIREVVNGFYDNSRMINPECTLAVISSGTGQGFAQSLGYPKEIDKQFKVIKNLWIQKTDIGRINFLTGEHSYFINEFQTGIGGEVVKNVGKDSKKHMGGFAFGLSVLKVINDFNPGNYSIQLDENLKVDEELTGVVISNGNYTGGGMQLTPDASLNDGYLDVLLIPALTKKEMFAVFPRIYSGRHLNDRRFRCYKVKSLSFTVEKHVKYEADGELLKESAYKVEVMPSALNIIRPTIRDGIK
jgi:YegS/Rv2252/BmrU family lipid kinase